MRSGVVREKLMWDNYMMELTFDIAVRNKMRILWKKIKKQVVYNLYVCYYSKIRN